MVDNLTKAERSALMARIRGRDTGPEWVVRRFLHKHGFRFRLHPRHLPGRPDIILPKLRTAIFVHGCFWHRHAGCIKTTMPSTRRAFWEAKFRENVERDRRKVMELSAQGWRTMTVWECEVDEVRLNRLVSQLKKLRTIAPKKLQRFLGGPSSKEVQPSAVATQVSEEGVLDRERALDQPLKKARSGPCR
jgi:DNA mismatch endonuclease (patch repair protein)